MKVSKVDVGLAPKVEALSVAVPLAAESREPTPLFAIAVRSELVAVEDSVQRRGFPERQFDRGRRASAVSPRVANCTKWAHNLELHHACWLEEGGRLELGRRTDHAVILAPGSNPPVLVVILPVAVLALVRGVVSGQIRVKLPVGPLRIAVVEVARRARKLKGDGVPQRGRRGRRRRRGVTWWIRWRRWSRCAAWRIRWRWRR